MFLYRFSTTRLFSKIPFTYTWIIKRAIGSNVETLLDLGCAKGIFTEVIARDENWTIDGVELYEKYIKDAKKIGIYRSVIRADLTNLPKSVKNTKYDVVLCHQVLEHIKKSDGLKAIKQWEKIAKKRVVIGTTVGFIEYGQMEDINRPEQGNELLEHKSGWTPEELKKMGYSIFGQGLRAVYGENGLARKTPRFLLPIVKIFSFLFSPIVYFYPSLAQIMICRKEV